MKKRIISTILMTIWIVLLSADLTFAITGVSAAESRILEELKAGAEVNGVVRTIPAAYLNQVENELIKNKIDLSNEQAEIILGKIEEARQLLKTLNIKDLNDIKNTETVLRLLTLIDEAASAAKYTVSIDLAKMSVNIINPEGEMIFVSTNTINQTGSDIDNVIPFCFFVLSILLGILILAHKLRLFDNTDYLKRIRRTIGKVSKGISHEK